jgi:stage II sporulation protein D
VPYLTARADDLVPRVHRSWSWTASAADLRAALHRDARTDVGSDLTGITVSTRDQSGRAQQVTVEGDVTRVMRGEEFRAVVTSALGARTIQSTRLTVRQTKGGYVFEGTGFGHGVGLCQAGAAARARRGETTLAILGAYFSGAGVAIIRP